MKRKIIKSINVKIIVFFSVLSILPIILLGIYSYNTSIRALENQVKIISTQALNVVSANMDLILQQINDFSVNIAKNEIILTAVEETENNINLYKQSNKTVKNILDSLAISLRIPVKAIIISSSGHIYHNIWSYEGKIRDAVNKIINEDWYKANDKYNEFNIYLGLKTSYIKDFETEYHHYFHRNMYNNENTLLGMIVLDISTYAIDKLLDSIVNNNEDHVYMLDDKLNIISFSDGYSEDTVLSGLINDFIRDGKTQFFINYLEKKIGKDRIVIHSNLITKKWKLVYLVGRQYLFSNIRQILLYTGFIILILLIADFMLYLFLRSFITNPIIKLSKIMEKVKTGNFDIRFNCNTGCEISVLADGFNNMISYINNLIKKIKYEEKQLKEYEFSLLQAQIKPHFLYNSLNSIKIMSDLAESTSVSNAIVELINMLQYSIGNKESNTTMKEEIIYIKSYIYLNNIRFKNKFKLINKIQQEYDNIIIVKYLLQPIVENSLIHGLRDKQGLGHIVLSLKTEDDFIILSIMDDGLGMSKDTINKIMKNNKKKSESNHVGIFSVDKRIKLVYGKQYGIRINSKINEGTTVSITIPYINGESNS